ncbi:VCBS repeat-containing protein [Streptomyces sp. NA02950]|uniref:FG-GAP and VCBS repeat-containing protein n=1 Tax=Streptomyces sp. NA02950 TaxID=2742137 RepID=UPI0015922F96|nr:FG-GAP and VCBS repeat-containing protein [Streptomyces sp. NA02950]QKV96045.1 VCBS repeat-containing protein [Streptomyces sp. NA02950]
MIRKRTTWIGVTVVAVAAATLTACSGPGDGGSMAAPRKCHSAGTPAAPRHGDPAAGSGTPTRSSGTPPQADFDGDGHADLAMSGSGDVGDTYVAGNIAVAYGSGDGTGAGRCQLLTQADPAVPGEAHQEAEFGIESVARDFDEDGYTDLAATVFEDDTSHVIMLWGSRHGLASASRMRGADGSHVPGGVTDIGGEQLAAGDFTGDGHVDLVTGLGSRKGLLLGPFSRKGAAADIGKVPAPDLPDDPNGDLVFRDLVAGDLNGDGTDDLVTFYTDRNDVSSRSGRTGSSDYLAGGPDGFTEPDGKRLPGAGTGAVGDVDHDGYADLILSPRSDHARRTALEVVYGSKTGPGPRTTTVDRDISGVPGRELAGGEAVFTAMDSSDVDGDGYADLVAGAPGLRVRGADQAGAVLFLKGGPRGLTGTGARLLDQSAVGAVPAEGDAFGEAVRLTDMNGDHRADLVVGASGEGEGERDFTGSVWVLPGAREGLARQGARHIRPDDLPGLNGDPLLGQRFAR